MMEVVVTTGGIRPAKLQSNCYHQQMNIQFFYKPDSFLVAEPTVEGTENQWKVEASLHDMLKTAK